MKPKPIKLASVALDATTLKAGDGDKPVWVQVAKSGLYQGHKPPFTLNKAVFDEMIANFRAHPSYSVDAKGVGCEDVIPWDFEHMSSPSKLDFFTAIQGVPAQGWVQELKTESDGLGGHTLWALTRWLPQAQEYIRGGQYKWASVAFDTGAKDPTSGETMGARLFSVAMTNDPFIQGMEPLAAKNDSGAVPIEARYYEAADSTEDAFKDIKKVFSIPEMADLSEVVMQIEKLKEHAAAGTTPLGVEIDDIFCDLRKIFNLPALSSYEDILAELDKLILKLVEEQQAIESPLGAGLFASRNTSAASLAGAGGKNMELLDVLAEVYQCKATEAEVIACAKDQASLRAELRQQIGAENDSNKMLLTSVKAVVTDQSDKSERFIALTKALSVNDGEDPIARVTTLLKAEKDLEEIAPKYKELEEAAKVAENEKMASEVDRAIAVHKLGAQVKDALILFRRTSPDEFAKQYPLGDEKNDHLAKVIATGTKPSGQAAPKVELKEEKSQTIDLSSYAGANEGQKMANYILATNPLAKGWDIQTLYGEVNKMRAAQAGR